MSSDERLRIDPGSGGDGLGSGSMQGTFHLDASSLLRCLLDASSIGKEELSSSSCSLIQLPHSDVACYTYRDTVVGVKVKRKMRCTMAVLRRS